MARFIAVWTLGCVLAAAGPVAADESALEQSYGNGVHAYFSGDHAAALAQFNEAIEGGFKDARAYFFRGLTRMKMGNDKDAQADFQTAATLESADPDRSSTISKSLQRVQGQTRLKIEQYRSRARMAALQQQRAKDDSRFGKAKADERKAIEKQATDAAKAKDDDLFDDAKKPAEKADDAAAEEKPAEKPADKADEKPAEKADEAAEEKPAEKPAKKADAKPKEEAVDDPFKDDPDMKKEDAKPAAKAEEAAPEEKAGEEKPAEEKPAEEKPAEEKTDA